MRSTLLTVLLVGLALLLQGQTNLVSNGGFEEYEHCPDQSGIWSINALHWVSPNAASPDYYHVCALPNVFPPDTHQWPNMGVPANVFGYQPAHSGEAYMGLYCFSSTENGLRDYVQIQLTDSVVPNIRYQVSFYISVADNGKYSINTLGAYLSKEAIMSNDVYRFDVIPQILNTQDNPLTDSDIWVLITDTFSSRYGGEWYLTIGNFNPDSTSGILFSNPQGDISATYAYYYIDDVSVIALDSVPDGIEEHELSFSIYPNPATEVVQIEGRELAKLRFLDLSGRVIFTENIATDRHLLNLLGTPPGIYLLEITDLEGRRAVQQVVKAMIP